MKKLILSTFMFGGLISTNAQTTTQTNYGVFTQAPADGANYSTNAARVNASLALSAGYKSSPSSNVRTFSYMDMPASNMDAASTNWLTINNRNDYTRFKFRAVQNGESEFVLFDKTQQTNFFVHDEGNNTVKLIMPKANSRVMIGTNTYTDGVDTYSLSVNGNVRADRVKVYTTWADYVFEDNYKLPTLEEVEKHIKEKGHLQDIPSAKEVEANGIELGEMNKKLLQKIEELTLYTIELNKQVKELKGQIK